MKINLEYLFYMIMEHFDNVAEFHKVRLECWEKQNGKLRKFGCTPKNCLLYIDHLKGHDAYNFAKASERAEHGERVIFEFCRVLGIDQQKLYHMVRGINKWHVKRDWHVCFPFTEKNCTAIIGYMLA